jgi:DNA-binding XRE family transcriptional regulator
VGVSRLWINQIERGKPGASLHLVLRTFSALGSPLSVESETRKRRIVSAVKSPDINAVIRAAKAPKAP